MSEQINTNAEFQISGDTLRKYTGSSRHLVISEDIKGIASAAFLDVSTLESVTIPDGVEFLDRRCFENCIHLKTVSIPDSVTRIGEYAFSGCGDLDYVRLPAGLSRIESFTFRNCTSLTTVIIPPAVTEIALDAFIGCSSLESVHIHDGVTSFPAIFNHHPFTGCDKLTIYTPSGSAAEKFAIQNGIPYVIKTIDSPNQATDVVKPEPAKPKLTRNTIASTKGIFSYSDIEEYLPEDLTEKLLREAEEAEAAKKARLAAALQSAEQSYDGDAEAAGSAEAPYEADEIIYEAEQDQFDDIPEAPPAETAVEKPAERTEAPVVEPAPAPKKPDVRKAAPPAAPKPADPVPVVPVPDPVKEAEAARAKAAAEAEEQARKTEAAKAAEAAKKAEAARAAEAAKKAEAARAAEAAKKAEAVKEPEPVKAAEAVESTEPARPVKEKKKAKEKPVKEKKKPKEKPVKEKPAKPVKEKKKKEPGAGSSKGRTARIIALLVIAAVAIAVIVIAVMNMKGSKPQTGGEPTSQTETTQKDDYVLTLEDFVNSSDTAKSQIDQSIDGTDVKVTVSGNKLIYTYDLSNTEGLSADDADSDEIRDALKSTLDASNDRFVELCRSLEKDTGINGISVEVIYSYDDKILLTREYTSTGQNQ